ncbi:MAG: phytanoyl-CoA dioxygenase family protein [Saprospirales bacterium]|nr:phytanoyl-CoA dioxygenase family protein [Saprospirales bacterium]
MKAGELLIFNNKVFHASLPNTSAFKRPAVGIVFTCT